MTHVSPLHCDHSVLLVGLSYVVSVLGAYCALQWAALVPHRAGWAKAARVGAAALAMGGGAIWSMHFIAMNACRLPFSVAYDGPLTVASLAVAVGVTGAGLYLVAINPLHRTRLAAGGLITGSGIAAMHYTGMAAMRVPADLVFAPALVTASVVVAIVAATAALRMAVSSLTGLRRLLSAVVMGVAVCGMHYTAMAAVTFVPSGAATSALPTQVNAGEIGLWVFGATLIVLGLLATASYVDAREWVAAQRTADLTAINEALTREIEERKRAEAALCERTNYLNTLIEHSPMAILGLDAQRHIQFVNPAFERLFQYDRSELLGADVGSFITTADEATAAEIAEFARRVFSGETLHVTTARRRKDGQMVDVEMYAVPLTENGRLTGIFVLYHDISDRRQLEEQVRQSQKIEAVGTLAGGIAHDFNNLLTTILGYSNLLLDEVDASSPLHNDLLEIRKAGQRAESLTRQLLAFSRKQIAVMTVLDLNEIVLQMDNMLRRLIGEDIQMVTRLDGASGRIKADRGQVEQVLMNLVVNARDAMPHGGTLTIDVGAAAIPETGAGTRVGIPSGQYVRLAVRDTGVGMDESTRSRIFEPFFSTKAHGLGTGLGLSTVYGIVKQSGGHVTVDSEPGRGAHFQIWLPAVTAPVSAPQMPANHEPVKPGGGETIMVVEDDETVRRLACAVLRRQGYRIFEASNGNEALRVAAEMPEPIDLVLTDGVMPGIAVGQLIANLRESRPRTHILIMSGHTNEAIVRRGILESDIPFLQKPFTGQVLLQKVRAVLDQGSRA